MGKNHWRKRRWGAGRGKGAELEEKEKEEGGGVKFPVLHHAEVRGETWIGYASETDQKCWVIKLGTIK